MAIVRFWGVPIILKTDHNILFTTIYMYYLLDEIKHNVNIQCRSNHIEVKKKLKYMLKIDILRNSSHNILGCHEG